MFQLIFFSPIFFNIYFLDKEFCFLLIYFLKLKRDHIKKTFYLIKKFINKNITS